MLLTKDEPGKFKTSHQYLYIYIYNTYTYTQTHTYTHTYTHTKHIHTYRYRYTNKNIPIHKLLHLKEQWVYTALCMYLKGIKFWRYEISRFSWFLTIFVKFCTRIKFQNHKIAKLNTREIKYFPSLRFSFSQYLIEV